MLQVLYDVPGYIAYDGMDLNLAGGSALKNDHNYTAYDTAVSATCNLMMVRFAILSDGGNTTNANSLADVSVLCPRAVVVDRGSRVPTQSSAPSRAELSAWLVGAAALSILSTI